MENRMRGVSMDWNDLRFFLEVARTNSLTRTASKLKVSQSTVSGGSARLKAVYRPVCSFIIRPDTFSPMQDKKSSDMLKRWKAR